ncbi:hypothetical protein [Flavobacterium adhaerens]|uniref:hypothetical protein n=1 Tax=Flavobacterium adhaerens TaxID=3149043 RepID=UPI0032B3B86D
METTLKNPATKNTILINKNEYSKFSIEKVIPMQVSAQDSIIESIFETIVEPIIYKC